MERPVGQELLRRFSDFQLTESSGHSSEYIASDNSNGTLVDLTVLRPYFSEYQDGISKFFGRIEALQKLNHPNVHTPISFGESDGQIWFAVPHLTGETLSTVIENGKINFKLMEIIIHQLATCVDFLASQGIQHGDLTPENILITESGEIKISRFGITELVHELHPLLRTTIRVPDPHYSAPELLQHRNLTSFSDLYSIGVLTYEMITGQLPFPSLGVPSVLAEQMDGKFSPPSRLIPDLGPGIDDVISRNLAFDTEVRFHTAVEFEVAVGQNLAGITPDFVFGTTIKEKSERAEHGSKKIPEDLSGSEEELKFCPSCGQGNDPSLLYCKFCWSRLAGRKLPSGAEAQRLLRTFSREWRKNWALRRAILAGAILAPVIYVLSFFVALPVSKPTGEMSAISGPGEWVSHGKDFKNTSFSKNVDPIKGKVLWEYETNKPFTTSPTADDRRVYVSTVDNKVAALDIVDGRIIWEIVTPTPVDSTPVVTKEAIYFGLRNGEVWALDVQDGKKLWSFETGNPVFGSGQIFKGVLYIGSGDGYLYGLDALTGKKLWDYEVGGWVLNTPILYQSFVAVATASGWVWVIDITNGKKMLSYKTTGSIIQDPVSVGDKIIVGNFRGKLIAIDWNAVEYPGERGARYYRAIAYVWGLQDKAPIQKGFIWSRNFGKTVAVSSPAVADGYGYVVTSDGKLRSIDLETGDTIWTYNSYSRTRSSSPVIGGEIVYMGTDNGFIHAVNRTTGEEIARFFAGGGLVGQMIIADNSMFVASTNGTLYAFR